MRVSVISAPKLKMLGRLTDKIGRFEFGATVFQVLVIIYVPFSVCCAIILIDPYAIQGLHLIRLATVMRSVRVLALLDSNLSLDVIINFMRCFPCLEKLYIKVTTISASLLKFHSLLFTALLLHLPSYEEMLIDQLFITFSLFRRIRRAWKTRRPINP